MPFTGLDENGKPIDLKFNTDRSIPRLPVIIDGAEFTLDGNLNVDVAAFKDSSGSQVDSFVFTADEDLSGITPTYLPIGGVDRNNNRFRAFPIATENTNLPSPPDSIPISGWDGTKSRILKTDSNGKLATASDIWSESTTTLTWTQDTGQTPGPLDNGETNVAPTAADTAVDVSDAETIYIITDTNNIDTGAPNFDIKVIASADGTTYDDVYVEPHTAMAKDKVKSVTITPGMQYIKMRIDVHNVDVADAESLNSKIYVRKK